MSYEIRIFPLGDSALTVEFGRTISPELNKTAIALANKIDRDAFVGFIETVPAYASTTIFYDPVAVRRTNAEYKTAFECVKTFAQDALKDFSFRAPEVVSRHEIPVCFDGPDLADVAAFAGLPTEAVVEIFTSQNYRVYMLGFLPGFAYMGTVDERIAVPRKNSPRASVPMGSIGIAGRQTGIYSLPSPGGWQLIGRTEVEMFTPDDSSSTLMAPGDIVTFVAK